VGPNRLYRNNRDGTFTDVAEELNVTAPGPSFAVWFWDYINDGYEDIYASCTSGPVGVLVSDIRFELMHLYQGEPDGTFRDVTSEVQLDYPAEPMGANFGDLNNDGYLDFYLATGNVPYWAVRPNVMFLNSSAQSFQNVTMAGGFGHLQKGHGVSFADMDNDGDNDVYVQLGGAYRGDKFSDALFENPGFENNSITIELEGRTSNRSAIGARIKLMVTERGNSREIYRHVNSGGSFGANPLRQTIGIGNAERIDSVQIDWPASETRQVFTDVRSGQAIHIREGAEEFTEISVKQLVLGGGSPEQ